MSDDARCLERHCGFQSPSRYTRFKSEALSNEKARDSSSDHIKICRICNSQRIWALKMCCLHFPEWRGHSHGCKITCLGGRMTRGSGFSNEEDHSRTRRTKDKAIALVPSEAFWTAERVRNRFRSFTRATDRGTQFLGRLDFRTSRTAPLSLKLD